MPSRVAGRTAASLVNLAGAAAAATLLGLTVAAIAVSAGGALRTPTLGAGGIGLGLYLDALSVATGLLVALIGLIVMHYSRRYLDGDAGRGRFFKWLSSTLGAVLLLILAGNMLQFILAWIVASVGLHRLLLFYPDRPLAVLAARKKFLASRLGDISLLAAAALLYRQAGSLDYALLIRAPLLAQHAGANAGAAAGTSEAAAVLLVLAALLKSAQFPLHGWLVEVMETPTPVSALLHAGVINAGGFLALRYSPLIAPSPVALGILVVVGSATALFGSLVMLPQTSIKVSLAYSTVGQMGFMMLECGLGAFPSAWLHLAGHSLYKAHAFLSSGSIIELTRGSWTAGPGGPPHPGRWIAALAVIVSATLVVGIRLGGAPLERPGSFVLVAILLFAIAHLVASSVDERLIGAVIGRVAGMAALTAALFLVLHGIAERMLAGSVAAEPHIASVFVRGGIAVALAAFAAVIVLQSLLPAAASSARGRALYVHLANGLYVNTLANRLLLRWWTLP